MHELDASGNITVTYIADDKGNPVSVTRYNSGQATTCFYHYNAHGDVIAITDAGGNVVAKFSYDAWGVPSELNAAGAQQAIGSWTTATGGTPGQGLFLLFGSMLYDAAAGIYLTRTRAYNPKTGRFLSRDILDEDAKDGYDGFPFGKDAIGTNLYAWCGNNPVTRVDPSGLAWVPYQVQVPYIYLKWYTGSYNVPVISIYWLLGFIPIPYISSWKRVSYSFAIPKVGHRTETRYRWVQPPSRFVSFVSGVKKSLGYQPSKPVDCGKISYGQLTNGRSGAWGDLYDHYTSDKKSNGLENAAYDLGSIGVPPLALGAIANTVNDRRQGYISNSRLAWNVGTTVAGATKFFPASMATGFVDVMEHADDNGWLDSVNDWMRTD